MTGPRFFGVSGQNHWEQQLTTVYEGDRWTIRNFVSGYSNNAYLITCRRTSKSVIIDTPADPHDLLDAAADTEVSAILITHGHYDHVDGFEDVISKFDAPVGIGSGDVGDLPSRPGALVDMSDDAVITAGDILLRAIETPGHTPGSTSLMLPAESPGATPHVFTGDTLFPGGPGKTDSPGDFETLVSSLERGLFTLPSATVVLPGHGDATTVEAALEEYRAFASNRRGGEHGHVRWTE